MSKRLGKDKTSSCHLNGFPDGSDIGSTVCMYVFIKLHITTQSGPVILVILCHSH